MKKHIVMFKRAKALDTKFKTFLMNIMLAAVIFCEATEIFLNKKSPRQFAQLKNKIQALEAENDTLRREIETALYKQMLLPGMRSDILALMEACDRVINQYERVILIWSIEKIKVPPDCFMNTIKMAQITRDCVGALMDGTKAFLGGQMDVEKEVQECYFLEHLVDQLVLSLKEQIFKKKISLAHKLQLNDFVISLEKISDLAEDAADKLKIISVKHAL